MNLQSYFFTIDPVGLTGAAAQRYVSQVHEHLRWIYRTSSGRLLLNCIRRPSFPVVIRPHPINECNATGGSERTSPTQTALRGFATYTPGHFGHGGVCRAKHGASNSGRLFDEILFHELVHVFRTATGKWDESASLGWAMRQYDDNEEFVATLCTNLYIADRSNKIKTSLHAGHRGFDAMSAAEAGRFSFFSSSATALALVKKFCADNPIFTKAISDKLGDVEYNPIADYLRFPKLCEAFSMFGQFNDRRQFEASLKANGVTATVIEFLMHPIAPPR